MECRAKGVLGAGAARTLVVAAVVAALAAGPGRAQVPGEIPRVTGSVQLTLVNVDVVVTGKDGKPVEGLTAADFTMRHGGKAVAITNFREEKAGPESPRPSPAAGSPAERTPPAPPATPAAPEVPALRRYVVVFVDHLALPDPRERQEVFGSLKTLLRTTLRPGDAAMIVA